MVALLATVCGCATRPSAPQKSIAPPSAPDDAPPPEPPPSPPAWRTPRTSPQISPSVDRAIDYVLEQSDHPRAAVVDFAARSSTPRFHVIDCARGEVLQSFRVAHGHGSEGKRDDGYAEVFSNESGSNASSLGLYRTAETYRGVYPGLSMRLDGLSSTNSNAGRDSSSFTRLRTWIRRRGRERRPGDPAAVTAASFSRRPIVTPSLTISWEAR